MPALFSSSSEGSSFDVDGYLRRIYASWVLFYKYIYLFILELHEQLSSDNSSETHVIWIVFPEVRGHSLQYLAVCLWGVTVPNIRLQTSVMNLDQHWTSIMDLRWQCKRSADDSFTVCLNICKLFETFWSSR